MGEGNGTKIFVGLGAAIALVTLFLAIVRPMQIQINNLQVEIRNVENRTKEKISSEGKVDVVRLEILEREVHEILDWKEDHDQKIEARDASQWERILSLERTVFDKIIPIPE